MIIYLKRNIGLALEGILQNKLRAFLTALGIIFGVFAVVAMMAIGNGAKKSIIDQLKVIGTNNIIVKAIPPKENSSASEEETNSNGTAKKKSYTPGLNMDDLAAIKELIPDIETLGIETAIDSRIIYEKNIVNAKCIGVNNGFFDINNLTLKSGFYFNDFHIKNAKNVCILGADAAARLFLGKDPINKTVKANNAVFQVIGVLDKR